jgi:hypothetical protein
LRVSFTILQKNSYLRYTLLHKESLSFHSYRGLELEQTSKVLPSFLLILPRNIYRCSRASGNVWANPSGTGFSQTCTDADKDGICDAQYTLDSNNIDYLPLALVTTGVKGDLNGNGQSADAGDLVLMKRASIEGTAPIRP